MEVKVITTGTSHADMELLRGSGDSVSGRRGVSFRDGRRVDTQFRDRIECGFCIAECLLAHCISYSIWL